MQFKKMLALFLISIITLSCMASSVNNSFQAYWSEFRKSALAGDHKKLITLTQFPLEVKGVDDSTPTSYVKNEQFAAVFKKAMRQQVIQVRGEELIETDLQTILKNTRSVPDANVEHGAHLENLMFEFIEGRWVLTRVYLEE